MQTRLRLQCIVVWHGIKCTLVRTFSVFPFPLQSLKPRCPNYISVYSVSHASQYTRVLVSRIAESIPLRLPFPYDHFMIFLTIKLKHYISLAIGILANVNSICKCNMKEKIKVTKNVLKEKSFVDQTWDCLLKSCKRNKKSCSIANGDSQASQVGTKS